VGLYLHSPNTLSNLLGVANTGKEEIHTNVFKPHGKRPVKRAESAWEENTSINFRLPTVRNSLPAMQSQKRPGIVELDLI
jgi:hypothetical protein